MERHTRQAENLGPVRGVRVQVPPAARRRSTWCGSYARQRPSSLGPSPKPDGMPAHVLLTCGAGVRLLGGLRLISQRARSSLVERFLDTEEAGGSIPLVPTGSPDPRLDLPSGEAIGSLSSRPFGAGSVVMVTNPACNRVKLVRFRPGGDGNSGNARVAEWQTHQLEVLAA